MKTKQVNHRQTLALWEVHRSVPESFKDCLPAHTITQLEAIAPMKIERSFVVAIGSEIEDEEGYLWEVTGTRAFMKRHDSKKKGRASIIWMKLKRMEF